MKRKLSLIPLALLITVCLAGLPISKVHAAELDVSLAWSGLYNYWDITFKNRQTGEWYEFHTTDSHWPNAYLGTVPDGNYDIEFNSGYSRYFEFGIDAPGYYGWHFGLTSYTWYNAPLSGYSSIMIHQGI